MLRVQEGRPLGLTKADEARTANIGRHDIALLKVEFDGVLERSKGFAPATRELVHLTEVRQGVRVGEEEVATFGYSQRLACETLRLHVLTPAGEDLRSRRTPEDLGMDVVLARGLELRHPSRRSS